VTEGAIYVDGVDIREYSEEEYRKLFSVVFQDFSIFAFSLRENIEMGDVDYAPEDSDKRDEKVKETLELSGLAEDVTKLPNGLDTTLYKSFDEKGTELSGGQRQKTAISRALYRNAPVVILDEPTAALDPMAEYDIYRKFDTLVGNKSAIYISHRLSSCKFCDRIAVFSDGTIKEYGTHDELVAIPDGIYAEMFHAQAQYYVA
jgi:ATP-binding cassette subfamily C protein